MIGDTKVLVSQVKFMDIQEDFMGRDVMTFEFDGKVYESYIFR